MHIVQTFIFIRYILAEFLHLIKNWFYYLSQILQTIMSYGKIISTFYDSWENCWQQTTHTSLLRAYCNYNVWSTLILCKTFQSVSKMMICLNSTYNKSVMLMDN